MPRPSKAHERLTAPAREDGTTVAETILDWLRLGIPYDTSILRANVPTATMQHWLREGARIHQLVVLNPDRELDDNERTLYEFSLQVDQARAEGEARYQTLMGRLASGGYERRTVTVKVERQERTVVNERGVSETVVEEVEVERVTRTENAAPSFGALKWILENRYGRKAATHVVVDGHDPLSPGERAGELAETIESWLKSREESGAGSAG